MYGIGTSKMSAVCEGRKHNNSNSTLFKSWLVFYATFWDQASILHPPFLLWWLFWWGSMSHRRQKNTPKKRHRVCHSLRQLSNYWNYTRAMNTLLLIMALHDDRSAIRIGNPIWFRANQINQESWQNCFTFLSCDIQKFNIFRTQRFLQQKTHQEINRRSVTFVVMEPIGIRPSKYLAVRMFVVVWQHAAPCPPWPRRFREPEFRQKNVGRNMGYLDVPKHVLSV